MEVSLPIKRAVLIVVSFGLLCLNAAAQAAQPLVLRGTVITPDEVFVDGFVSIVGEQISAVGPFTNRPSSSARIIETDSIIAPGLIDLHDHITWNLFPRWKRNMVFSNRYEWQQLTSYKIALSTPHSQLYADRLHSEMNLYGEVKSIVNTPTSLAAILAPFSTPPTYTNYIP